MTKTEIAEELEKQMESMAKTKNEVRGNMNSREYWAGKEQAFYEAWQMVASDIKSGEFAPKETE